MFCGVGSNGSMVRHSPSFTSVEYAFRVVLRHCFEAHRVTSLSILKQRDLPKGQEQSYRLILFALHFLTGV
jgi:hypothetical protein